MTAPDSPPAAPAPAAYPERPAGPAPSIGARIAGVFVSDVPLKLLALVLALLMWKLTREQLKSNDTFKDVIVDVLELPPDVRLRDAAPYRVDIAVHGTRAEIDQARAALEERSRHVGLRMPSLDPHASEGAVGPLSETSNFALPFASRDIVLTVGPAPVVSWVRVEERTIAIALPAVLPPTDSNLELAEGYPKLDVSTARVLGPMKAIHSLPSIEPDAVDPNRWLASNPDLATPAPFESAFETWRQQDPLRSRRLLTIAPDTARGTLKYRRTEGRALSHALDVLVSAEALEKMRDFEPVLSGGSEFDAATLRLTLKVRADKRTLDDMVASPAKWTFAVQVPPPPGPGEPAVENRPVPVRLTFDPAAGTGRAGAPPAILDGSPTLFVTLRPRGR